MPKRKTTAELVEKTDAAQGAHEEQARYALRQFRIVFSSVKKHFQDIESKCGVSGAQLWAISEMADSPGLRVSELAQAMSIHQSTASNLVGELERNGFIRKERGTDQRVVRLYLTEQGSEVVARAPKPMIGVLPDALQRLPENILGSLSGNMDVLIATMQLKDEAAATKPLSDI
ncbi:MAG: MarR family transcriptional regulator [Sulfuricella sp.]|nr:MarR family transcriptional regulator [Sulfuricella sp.]